ncbi:SMODS domain-containing nucleotidyltransferase [Sinorhizobium meliloti]|uniref:SMODS domain-containing nucleotidyltransferase n=1 Tax=Rhizobium meliloti TaxID=382 RepID=UPI0013152623|nr:hypothetical protein [Sinorhizobium meliloti]
MKLVNDFKDFLKDTVNLNQTRIGRLEERVETIKSFIKSSDWEPKVTSFVEQGSWAHDTIIRPVDGGEFDADLLVMVKAVDGWSAAQYVKELGRVFQPPLRCCVNRRPKFAHRNTRCICGLPDVADGVSQTNGTCTKHGFPTVRARQTRWRGFRTLGRRNPAASGGSSGNRRGHDHKRRDEKVIRDCPPEGFAILASGKNAFREFLASVITRNYTPRRKLSALIIYRELATEMSFHQDMPGYRDVLAIMQSVARDMLPLGPNEAFLEPVARRNLHSIHSASKVFEIPFTILWAALEEKKLVH